MLSDLASFLLYDIILHHRVANVNTLIVTDFKVSLSFKFRVVEYMNRTLPLISCVTYFYRKHAASCSTINLGLFIVFCLSFFLILNGV
jgi:hypothetical protein